MSAAAMVWLKAWQANVIGLVVFGAYYIIHTVMMGRTQVEVVKIAE